MEITKEKLLFAIGCTVFMALYDYEKYTNAKALNPAEVFNWGLAGARWMRGFLGGLGIGEGIDAVSSAISTAG